MGKHSLREHLDRLGPEMEELRTLTGTALPDRKARSVLVNAVSGSRDAMTAALYGRSRLFRVLETSIRRLRHRHNRAARWQVMRARLLLASAGMAGFLRLYWRVFAILFVAILLIGSVWLFWSEILSAALRLRDSLQSSPANQTTP